MYEGQRDENVRAQATERIGGLLSLERSRKA